MELTRERIEICANAHVDAETRAMAKQLLAEMDKPSVWTDAPDNARYAIVEWYEDSGRDRPLLKSTFYCRTLPKSRIDEIAEEATSAHMKEWGTPSDGFLARKLPEIIKSAILKDREEREAER